MRRLEKSGPLILGFAILLVFGLLLPESDRHGMTYLAAVLLGLLAGLEGFRAFKDKAFSFQLGVAAGGMILLVLLLHLTWPSFLGDGQVAQAVRHVAVFALSAFFLAFGLVVFRQLRKTHRGWRRILFFTVCVLLILPVLFSGEETPITFFWIVFLLFGIRWREVRALNPGPLALLILAAALAGFTPLLGQGIAAGTLIASVSSPGTTLLAGPVAVGLFEILRIGVRLFCLFFALFGLYHWTAVLLFGRGRVRAKLLGVYFLTALIPLSLFTVLVLFGLYLMIASYRSTLTKNMFHAQQVRFHRWTAAMSSRSGFWERLRPVEGGVRRLPLSQIDLYPKVLFDVLREVRLESDSVWVYTVVGGDDTVRIPGGLWDGGTTMGVCDRELCLYALLPTKGFILRSWIPITRDFLLRLKETAGTDITVYPRGPRTIGTRLGGSGGARMEFSFADADSTAEFDRISTREPRRRQGWLDWELIAGMNALDGVDWQAGRVVSYSYLLWLSPLRLWQTIFNPEEPINLGMRATFYLLGIIFFGVMVAISWVGWRVAGGINRSARSLEKGVQELRIGHLDYKMPVIGGAEFRQVAESFNLLTADIRRMLRDLAEKERLESELAVARTIQEALLPDRLPHLPGIEIAARSIPAHIVGGDYYDVVPLPDGSYLLALGDVSGKGIASALVTAKVQASLRTLAAVRMPLAELAAKLNHAICQGAMPDMFVSLFLARLDTQRLCLEYVNGGHDFPILCRDGTVERLEEGGIVLGVFPDAIYREGVVERLERGRLLIYSDGLAETKNLQDREYGAKALVELVKAHGGAAGDLLDAVFLEVEAYSEGLPAEDDRTAMALVF